MFSAKHSMLHSPAERWFTLLLVVLVVACALWLFPLLPDNAPTRTVLVPEGIEVSGTGAAHMYTWKDGLVRIGRVEFASEAGRWVFEPFPEYRSFARGHTHGVLFKNDVMNYWRITTAPSREKLSTGIESLLGGYFAAFQDFLQSEHFQERYADSVQSVMGDAFRKAMIEGQADGDMETVYAEVERIVLKTFGDDVVPMVFESVVDTIGSQLAASPWRIMNFFKTGELEPGFKEELVRRFREHPRFDRNMTATLHALVESPIVRRFSRDLAGTTFAHATQDPRFSRLVSAILTDPRLQERVSLLSHRTAATFIEVGRAVLSRPDGKSLDPFAARVLGNLLFDAEEWMFLLLEEHHLDAMKALDFPLFTLPPLDAHEPEGT